MTDPAKGAPNPGETAFDEVAGPLDRSSHNDSLRTIDSRCQRSIDHRPAFSYQNLGMKSGFGARLAEMRNRIPLRQEMLAQRLTDAGIECGGRGSVSAWEKERNSMPIAAFAWLCDASGTSADWALFERDMSARDAFEAQLLTLFRGIDRDAQQSILATINTIHRSQHPAAGPSPANPFPKALPPKPVGA